MESHWNERLRKKQTSHTTEPGRRRWGGGRGRERGGKGRREGGKGEREDEGRTLVLIVPGGWFPIIFRRGVLQVGQ